MDRFDLFDEHQAFIDPFPDCRNLSELSPNLPLRSYPQQITRHEKPRKTPACASGQVPGTDRYNVMGAMAAFFPQKVTAVCRRNWG
jgi:hypothetical protein